MINLIIFLLISLSQSKEVTANTFDYYEFVSDEGGEEYTLFDGNTDDESFDASDFDEYELKELNDDIDVDFDMDNDMDAEDLEFDLGDINPNTMIDATKLIEKLAADKDDVKQQGIKRVEESVLELEKVTLAAEEADRQALIDVDKNIMTSRGVGKEAKIAGEKVKEGKQVNDRAVKLFPLIRKKFEDAVKILPRREGIRLVRRFDLRHRFDFLIEQERML